MFYTYIYAYIVYIPINSTIYYICAHIYIYLTSLVAQMVKASAYNAGDPGLILGSGRCPGEGNGNPLQYFCLENPMDGEAW